MSYTVEEVAVNGHALNCFIRARVYGKYYGILQIWNIEYAVFVLRYYRISIRNYAYGIAKRRRYERVRKEKKFLIIYYRDTRLTEDHPSTNRLRYSTEEGEKLYLS